MDDGPLAVSDLPVRNGRVYHLDLAPGEIADNIIIVGDPGRVAFLADEFMSAREVDRFHRGFRSITGTAKENGRRFSVITSGIGTTSMEIVLNEITALNEIDFRTRKRKKKFSPLFYNVTCPDACCRLLEVRVREALASSIEATARFKGRICPYVARAHPEVRVALEREALHLGVRCRKGITVSSSGFFANEGRKISRINPTAPDLLTRLAGMETGISGLKVENIEMESSFLLHFMGGVGYRAGVICAVINKHSDGSMITDYLDHVREAAQIILQVFKSLE
jgi:uridine phosphorylase